jgi:serine protease SohB
MNQLLEFGFFFLKTAVIVVAILLVISNIIAASLKTKEDDKQKVKFKNKSKEYKKRKQATDLLFLDPKTAKKIKKQNLKKDKKAEKKGNKETISNPLPKLFVLNFNGDVKASQTDHLSNEITHILECAKAGDEVLVKLESPGGMVSGYGLAASELKRIKDSGFKLRVSVDKVAASGGYMMACVADQIMAAPFAIIGSIGVVAQLPNFHKVLKKNDVDYEIITAGKYKRTLTVFGENTDEGREKFKEQLEEIHILFKNFVTKNRPKLNDNIEDIATGEYWFGEQCLEKNLIDEIKTSEDFLFNNKHNYEIFKVSTEKKKSFIEKITESTAQIIATKLENLSLWKGI